VRGCDRGAMACRHPAEERQRVFDGGWTPREDRVFCGLCGELIYLVSLPAERQGQGGGLGTDRGPANG